MVFKKLNKHDTINWVWFNLRVGQQDRCGQFARCGLNGFLGCGISRGGCAVANLASRYPHFVPSDHCLVPSLSAVDMDGRTRYIAKCRVGAWVCDWIFGFGIGTALLLFAQWYTDPRIFNPMEPKSDWRKSRTCRYCGRLSLLILPPSTR